ncbi:MAG: flavin reductase family protein [Myxococcaceae bacterium]|nr:flavin reductase family protein [Myxococcaceae bacterium]
MSHWPSGVAVVTTHLDGQDYGMTVSSLTSVSLHPSMISVCIDKRTTMCSILQQSRSFAASMLDSTQRKVGQTFSDSTIRMPDRFKKHAFQNLHSGNRVLSDGLAWLDCNVHSFHDIGDHVIFVGEVLEAKTLSTQSPIVYYRRGWHRVADIDGSPF